MVVDSILPHAESGPNDHRKDAPSLQIGGFQLLIFAIKSKDQKYGSEKLRFINRPLTHIGKLSGNDSGDFPETFSKKNILLYCDVTTDDN